MLFLLHNGFALLNCGLLCPSIWYSSSMKASRFDWQLQIPLEDGLLSFLLIILYPLSFSLCIWVLGRQIEISERTSYALVIILEALSDLFSINCFSRAYLHLALLQYCRSELAPVVLVIGYQLVLLLLGGHHCFAFQRPRLDTLTLREDHSKFQIRWHLRFLLQLLTIVDDIVFLCFGRNLFRTHLI